ncbi:hypothetical protein ACLMJK_003271 [Lecanora helva]
MATNSRMRSACDACHKMKVRCSGEVPCETCLNSGNLCLYSYTGRLGRPKGTRNQKGRANTERAVLQSPTESGKDIARAERSSPPRSARPANSRPQSAQVQQTPRSQEFAMMEDVATSAPPVGTSEYGDMFEIDPFASNFGDASRSQEHAGQNVDFSSLFFSNGQDQAFLNQSTQDQMGGIEQHQSPMMRTPASISLPTPPDARNQNSNALECTCLQQNTELLCSFKLAEAMKNQDPYRIDAVLRATQEAWKPWQNLINCRTCAFNEEQEVIQIAFMTIRIILLRFQNLVPLCDPSTPSTEGSTESETQQPWQRYGVRLTLGAYEVTRGESSTVTRVLLLGAIRRIKSLFVPFKDILDRKRPKLDGSSGIRSHRQTKNGMIGHGHPASNLDHTKHLLQGLGNFVQTLERSLDRDYSDRTLPMT